MSGWTINGELSKISDRESLVLDSIIAKYEPGSAGERRAAHNWNRKFTPFVRHEMHYRSTHGMLPCSDRAATLIAAILDRK